MKSSTIVVAVIAASCLAWTATADGNRPLKIVATSFPHYDWTREILGERLAETDLVLLQQSGADLHSYSPSAPDLMKICACDLFIFVGGESDEWTERALALKGNPGRRVVNLVKALGSAAKEEKPVDGMEHGHHRHDDDHDEHEEHDDHEEHGHEEHEEIDEHVWLSLHNASALVKVIAASIAGLDPANAATYRANAAAYCSRLDALDRAYAATVAAARVKTILVADRFPFRYLADDYGLKYFAAFAGCSTESEASFKTIAFLAKKIDELELPVILTIEGTKHKIADAVKRSTKTKDQRILALDSLQSTGGAAAEKASYLGTMEKNLETLKSALK